LPIDEPFQELLHERLGCAWPCASCDAFAPIWTAIGERFARRGLRYGAGAYGGWDDGDPNVAQAVYSIVRHRRPEAVIETGVARGITSRVILEALEQNDAGSLYSIDLPPLLERELQKQTGFAVSERLTKRWTLIHGSSRRKLPALLRGLGRQVGLFVHDSFHSERNLLFEWETVLPALVAEGILAADDVERHRGVVAFRERHGVLFSLVGAHSEGTARFAIVAPRQ
jgi:hypothetical protein